MKVGEIEGIEKLATKTELRLEIAQLKCELLMDDLRPVGIRGIDLGVRLGVLNPVETMIVK